MKKHLWSTKGTALLLAIITLGLIYGVMYMSKRSPVRTKTYTLFAPGDTMLAEWGHRDGLHGSVQGIFGDTLQAQEAGLTFKTGTIRRILRRPVV